MRTLSLSLVAFAVLSLVPATSAQQAAPPRKSNGTANAPRFSAQNNPWTKSYQRFQAWQASVASRQQGQNRQPGQKAQANKYGQTVSTGNSSGSLQQQFVQRQKIKQAAEAAIRARQQAFKSGKQVLAGKGDIMKAKNKHKGVKQSSKRR